MAEQGTLLLTKKKKKHLIMSLVTTSGEQRGSWREATISQASLWPTDTQAGSLFAGPTHSWPEQCHSLLVPRGLNPLISV